MPNHYHLLVSTPRPNLSAGMQQFQTSYTAWFNAKHQRIGHLYAGRYKAPLVEDERYLLKLTRYIHLNPVMTPRFKDQSIRQRTEALRQYRWSTYRSYAGLTQPMDWIAYAPLPEVAASGHRSRTQAYRRYVEVGLARDDNELREAMERSSKAVGSEAFCRWVEGIHTAAAARRRHPEDIAMRRTEAPLSVESITEAVARHYSQSSLELLQKRGNSEAKDVLTLAFLTAGGRTQRDVGRLFGHADGATVGKRWKCLRENTNHRQRIERVWKRISKRLIANCKA
jgi:hypothetical protein